VGVAVGVAGRVRHHQEEKFAAQDAAQEPQAAPQQQYEEPQPQYAPAAAPAPAYAAPAPAAAAPAGGDLATQLQQLASLKDQGILSEEEFAEAKAKLLNG
jgi:hypothetical protein